MTEQNTVVGKIEQLTNEAPQVGLSAVERVVIRKSPFEIAEDWYKQDEIYEALKKAGTDAFGACDEIPSDVKSREFANWLTTQYRLAMSKGILMGRSGE